MQIGYSYIRFSSKKQATGDSLRRQLESTEQYCKEFDITLNQSLSFQDLGTSARLGQNITDGGLGRFLIACRKGLTAPGSVFICESLDRCSREQVPVALKLFLELLDYVDIVTLMDGNRYSKSTLDTTDLIISISIMQRAFDESHHKSQRVSKAYMAKRKGVVDGSHIMTSQGPFWLLLNEDKDGWNVIEGKAEVIRKMYTKALAGEGTYKIMKWLNGNNIPAARGGSWSLSSTQRMLTNKQVIGVFQMMSKGGPVEVVENYYPAIISERDYYAVQAMRSKRSKGSAGPSGNNFTNLFKGLIKCHCGSSMHHVSKGSKERKDLKYLVCSKARSGKGCTYKSYRYQETEKFLITMLSFLDYSQIEDDNRLKVQGDIGKLQESIKGMEGKVSNLLRAVEDSAGDTVTILVAQLSKRETELQNLEEELKHKESEIARMSAVESSQEVFKTEDRLRLNQFLHQHLESITLKGMLVRVQLVGVDYHFEARLDEKITADMFKEFYGSDSFDLSYHMLDLGNC